MAAFSNFLENELLDHALGTGDFDAPSAVYVALATADLTDANVTTNEVSGGGYARQAATFAAASGGSASTSATITFPVATADLGTITHFGLYDAATGGNLLYHGELNVPKVIGDGDTFEIQTGNLTISHD